jgi:hypothetical protein
MNLRLYESFCITIIALSVTCLAWLTVLISTMEATP